jgi:Ser/Thr protein kinase RdoA (MazF antagonist)
MAGPLPLAWQHGDVHPNNVFVLDDGSLRVFDFGDGQWAHAAESLCVPYGWITARTTMPWQPVLEAYADAWDLDPARLQVLLGSAELTQAVNRAASWSTFLDEATAAEWKDWGEGPIRHLSRVLDPMT